MKHNSMLTIASLLSILFIMLAPENLIQRFSARCNIVTLRSPGYATPVSFS
jgi:hypothetical protein